MTHNEMKIMAGMYKVSTGHSKHYANINKKGNEWHADIRNGLGELEQYAGIWNTKKEAIEEAVSILERKMDLS